MLGVLTSSRASSVAFLEHCRHFSSGEAPRKFRFGSISNLEIFVAALINIFRDGYAHYHQTQCLGLSLYHIETQTPTS